MFDLTSPKTYSRVKGMFKIRKFVKFPGWLDDIKTHCAPHIPPIVLVGNKADMQKSIDQNGNNSFKMRSNVVF